jgi:hypothetical protein
VTTIAKEAVARGATAEDALLEFIGMLTKDIDSRTVDGYRAFCEAAAAAIRPQPRRTMN